MAVVDEYKSMVSSSQFRTLDPDQKRQATIEFIQQQNARGRELFGDQWEPHKLQKALINQIPEESYDPGIEVISPSIQKFFTSLGNLTSKRPHEPEKGEFSTDRVSERDPFLIAAESLNTVNQAVENVMTFPIEQLGQLGEAVGESTGLETVQEISGSIKDIAQRRRDKLRLDERASEISKLSITHPTRIAFTVEQSIPFMVTSLAGAGIMSAPGAAVAALPLLAADNFDELKDRFDIGEALTRAFTAAIPQAALESYFPASLANKVKFGKLTRFFDMALSAKSIDQARALLNAAIAEGGTEALQEVLSISSGAESFADAINGLSSKEGIKRLSEAGFAGGVLGPLFTGALGFTEQTTSQGRTGSEQPGELDAPQNQETEEPVQDVQESPIQGTQEVPINKGPEGSQVESDLNTDDDTFVESFQKLAELPKIPAKTNEIAGETSTLIISPDTKPYSNQVSEVIDRSAIDAPSFKETIGNQEQDIIGQSKQEFENAGINFIIRPESFSRKAFKNFVDHTIRIADAQKQIEEQGGFVSLKTDVYKQKRLSTRRIAARINWFERNVMKPFVSVLSSSNVTSEQLDLYRHAKHASERNEAMGFDGASGMTNEQSEKILGEFSSDENVSLNVLSSRLDAIVDSILEYQVKSGILSPEQRQQISQKYEFYSPLGREFEEFASTGGVTGKGSGVLGTGIYRAKGNVELKVLPITAQIMAKAQGIIEQVETNLLVKTLAQLVRDNPSSNIWSIKSRKAIGKTFGEDGEIIFAKPDDNEIGFREDGKQKFIAIHDLALKKAMTSEDLSKSVPIFRGILQFQSKMITAWDITFGKRNFERGLGEALINVQEIRQLELTKDEAKGLTREVLKNTPSAVLGYLRFLNGKPSKWSDIVQDFQFEGGESGAFWLQDIKRLNKALKKHEKRFSRQGFKKLQNAPSLALEFINDLNTAAENASRVALYDSLVKRGVPKKQAAFIVGELTVDFQRQGEYGPTIKSLWLFINPAIQGPVRFGRALVKSNRARAAVGGLFIAGVLRAHLAQLIDSDEDDATYDYKKNTSINLPTGFGEGVTIVNLPYGANAFFAAGQYAAYYSMGKITADEAMQKTVLAGMDSFNPLGGSRLSFTNLAPTPIQPPLEIQQNEAWHGGPVYPEEHSFEVQKPNHQQYWDSVSDSSRIITRWLALASATDKHPNGLIDISPEWIDYFVTQYGGGVARGIQNTYDTAYSIFTDQGLPKSSHIPFLREIISDIDIHRYNRNLVFEMMDESRIVKFDKLQTERFNRAVKSAASSGDKIDSKWMKRTKEQFNKNQTNIGLETINQ